jgi:serine/threonine protein kinase
LAILPSSELKLVLFCARDNKWKVADFGLTNADKRSGNRTEAGRGTHGYRAPEIVTEVGKGLPAPYTNAVDVFAIGCILYEICYLRKAFSSDFAVQQHSYTKRHPAFPNMVGAERMPSFPDERSLHGVILRILHLNPTLRPTAADLCRIFTLPEAGANSP